MSRTTLRRPARFFLFAALVFLPVCLATPAYAGFEWVPPPAAPKIAPAPVQQQPATQSENTENVPVVVVPDNMTAVASPVESYEAAPLAPIPLTREDAALAPMPAPVVATTSPPAPVVRSPAPEPVIHSLPPPQPVQQGMPLYERAAVVAPQTLSPAPTARKEPAMKVRIMTPRKEDVDPKMKKGGPRKVVINPFPMPKGKAAPLAIAPAAVTTPSYADAPHAVKTPAPFYAESLDEPMMVTTDEEPAPVYDAPAIKNEVLSEAPVFDETIGFGSDMPLAMALRQVVPAEYSFSFGQNVNPGERVSWNGGKPWNDVVSDMVMPLNLKASVRGRTVYIEHAG